MANKKVYAVKKGKETGIFFDWSRTKAAVDGFPGAEYKGFPDLESARAYLGEVPDLKNQDSLAEVKSLKIEKGRPESFKKAQDIAKIRPRQEDALLSYVDGSYEHAVKKYAFGCVFILADGRVYVENGSGDNPESAALRNVTGEMLGAMFAVRTAMVNGFQKIELRYDYEGIEKWVTGAWKSKQKLTKKYAAAMQGWGKEIQISFTKVAAHTNVYYNEMADKLAKEALEKETGIPKVRLLSQMEEI